MMPLTVQARTSCVQAFAFRETGALQQTVLPLVIDLRIKYRIRNSMTELCILSQLSHVTVKIP